MPEPVEVGEAVLHPEGVTERVGEEEVHAERVLDTVEVTDRERVTVTEEDVEEERQREGVELALEVTLGEVEEVPDLQEVEEGEEVWQPL